MNDFVVSPNITLRADAGFGRFDAEVVGGLLRAVDEGELDWREKVNPLYARRDGADA